MCEYAGLFEKLLGRPVEIRSANPGEPVPLIPEFVQGLMIGLCLADYSLPMQETARTFQVELTPPEAVIQAMLKQ